MRDGLSFLAFVKKMLFSFLSYFTLQPQSTNIGKVIATPYYLNWESSERLAITTAQRTHWPASKGVTKKN